MRRTYITPSVCVVEVQTERLMNDGSYSVNSIKTQEWAAVSEPRSKLWSDEEE